MFFFHAFVFILFIYFTDSTVFLLTNIVFALFPQKKKRLSERATPKKRKSETDVVSERRNPSRKARPPENFAVEEKSEPVHVRSPRTVDIKRLVEVQHPAHCLLTYSNTNAWMNSTGNKGLFDQAGY